jgi:16S rRNA (adenine1518-N6/adenine1519-N6)-dimethyltransferase
MKRPGSADKPTLRAHETHGRDAYATTTTKAELKSRGLSPRKAFGQNFMLDANFAAAIARDSAPGAGTLTLEVGPGAGALTRAILAADKDARVLAIEIDRGLTALLRETLGPELASGRLTLLEGDALASKHALSEEFLKAALEISARENRPRRVLCANLPYNAATPLLANLAADVQGLSAQAAVVTLQLELAERMFAAPGSAEYGALTAFMALRTKGEILRRVGNEVFWPRPNVDSAVIRLDFQPFGHGATSLEREEAQPFQQFLQKLFSQRRKTLRAVLKPITIDRGLGVSETARAEDLAPEILLQLFRSCRSRTR